MPMKPMVCSRQHADVLDLPPVEFVARRIGREVAGLRHVALRQHAAVRGQQRARQRQHQRGDVIGARQAREAHEIGDRHLVPARGVEIDVARILAELLDQLDPGRARRRCARPSSRVRSSTSASHRGSAASTSASFCATIVSTSRGSPSRSPIVVSTPQRRGEIRPEEIGQRLLALRRELAQQRHLHQAEQRVLLGEHRR